MMGSRTTAETLKLQLRLPVMAGPMFIASTPELVVAQCKAGIVGALPALNPRSSAALDAALSTIDQALGEGDAPYAVNLVAHRTNDRLAADLAIMLAHKPPIVIISLAAPAEIVHAVHAYGGLVFNDVISNRHARKCAEAGVDGLIAVCAGAGGHTGDISPFALTAEIRDWWDGPLALSGCIATGEAVLAAEIMGADFAYIGSPFLASVEANTQDAFKQMIADSSAQDVVVTDCFTGVRASFLRPSIEANGLDASALKRPDGAAINIKDGGSNAKAWRDIWSAGQGIGAVKRVEPAGAFIDALHEEYRAARTRWAQTLTR
jgi:nitronate monooxygenase